MPPFLKRVFGGLLLVAGIGTLLLPELFGIETMRAATIMFALPLISLGAVLLCFSELMLRRGAPPDRVRRLTGMAIIGSLLLPFACAIGVFIGSLLFDTLLSSFEGAGGFVAGAALAGGAVMAVGLTQILVTARERRAAAASWMLCAYGLVAVMAGVGGMFSTAADEIPSGHAIQTAAFMAGFAALALGAMIAFRRAPPTALPTVAPAAIPAGSEAAAMSFTAPSAPVVETPFDPAIERRCAECGYVMDISIRDCPRCALAARPISVETAASPDPRESWDSAQAVLGALGGLAAVLIGYLPLVVVWLVYPYRGSGIDISCATLGALGWIPGTLWPVFVARRWSWKAVTTGALAAGVAIPISLVLALPAVLLFSLVAALIVNGLAGGFPSSSAEWVGTSVSLAIAGPFVGAIAGSAWGWLVGGKALSSRAAAITAVSALIAAFTVVPLTWQYAAAAPSDSSSWLDLHAQNWEFLPYFYTTLALSATASGALLHGRLRELGSKL